MAGPFAPALRTLERGNRPEPPLGFFIVAGHRGDCHLAAEPLPVPVRLLLPADHVLSPGRGQSITLAVRPACRTPPRRRPSSSSAPALAPQGGEAGSPGRRVINSG